MCPTLPLTGEISISYDESIPIPNQSTYTRGKRHIVARVAPASFNSLQISPYLLNVPIDLGVWEIEDNYVSSYARMHSAFSHNVDLPTGPEINA